MSILKLLAAGVLGAVAWRAWQRHQAHRAPMPADDGQRTAPHGDPILAGERIDATPPLRPAAQASRGFGDA
ncbi:hypothetical protein [Luteimonas wenzhouensis]|jgi:hypothetical protein|uniref:Uncharacterized protein n=1 Tax=Luteimonas wenzhouensis TaxID=2599615 RepID=A0A5C5TYW0_9GAMM|nr:hypothetical protein [Luteimonas wenzhouensis]TWT18847.1 hypothetical protein FQY79_09410 [Luteimonas wenzhouensis]